MTQSLASRPLLLLTRLLLFSVLTGLSAMHVTAITSGAAHGSMPMAAAGPAHPMAAEPDLTSAGMMAPIGALSDHGLVEHGMGDCMLLAATGIALLGALLALAAARALRRSSPAVLAHACTSPCATSRRGPPRAPLPRVALCVMRV